jgi:hypothetical protein
MDHFGQNPSAMVEIEKYAPDLSNFAFLSIPGHLEEVHDQEIKKIVRPKFVDSIKKRTIIKCAIRLGTFTR